MNKQNHRAFHAQILLGVNVFSSHKKGGHCEPKNTWRGEVIICNFQSKASISEKKRTVAELFRSSKLYQKLHNLTSRDGVFCKHNVKHESWGILRKKCERTIQCLLSFFWFMHQQICIHLLLLDPCSPTGCFTKVIAHGFYFDSHVTSVVCCHLVILLPFSNQPSAWINDRRNSIIAWAVKNLSTRPSPQSAVCLIYTKQH